MQLDPFGTPYTITRNGSPRGQIKCVVKLWRDGEVTVAREPTFAPPGITLEVCSMAAWFDRASGTIRPKSGSWERDADSMVMREELGDDFKRALKTWTAVVRRLAHRP